MKVAIAQFDCTADDDQELTFKKGDIIIDVRVAEDEGDDWFFGRVKGTTAVGLFPGNYVKFTEEPDAAPPLPLREQPKIFASPTIHPDGTVYPRPLVVEESNNFIPIKAPPDPKDMVAATRQALLEKSNTLVRSGRERAASTSSRDGSVTSSSTPASNRKIQPSASFPTTSANDLLHPPAPSLQRRNSNDAAYSHGSSTHSSPRFPPKRLNSADSFTPLNLPSPGGDGIPPRTPPRPPASSPGEPHLPKRPALLVANQHLDPPPMPPRPDTPPQRSPSISKSGKPFFSSFSGSAGPSSLSVSASSSPAITAASIPHASHPHAHHLNAPSSSSSSVRSLSPTPSHGSHQNHSRPSSPYNRPMVPPSEATSVKSAPPPPASKFTATSSSASSNRPSVTAPKKSTSVSDQPAWAGGVKPSNLKNGGGAANGRRASESHGFTGSLSVPLTQAASVVRSPTDIDRPDPFSELMPPDDTVLKPSQLLKKQTGGASVTGDASKRVSVASSGAPPPVAAAKPAWAAAAPLTRASTGPSNETQGAAGTSLPWVKLLEAQDAPPSAAPPSTHRPPHPPASVSSFPPKPPSVAASDVSAATTSAALGRKLKPWELDQLEREAAMDRAAHLASSASASAAATPVASGRPSAAGGATQKLKPWEVEELEREAAVQKGTQLATGAGVRRPSAAGEWARSTLPRAAVGETEQQPLSGMTAATSGEPKKLKPWELDELERSAALEKGSNVNTPRESATATEAAASGLDSLRRPSIASSIGSASTAQAAAGSRKLKPWELEEAQRRAALGEPSLPETAMLAAHDEADSEAPAVLAERLVRPSDMARRGSVASAKSGASSAITGGTAAAVAAAAKKKPPPPPPPSKPSSLAVTAGSMSPFAQQQTLKWGSDAGDAFGGGFVPLKDDDIDAAPKGAGFSSLGRSKGPPPIPPPSKAVAAASPSVAPGAVRSALRLQEDEDAKGYKKKLGAPPPPPPSKAIKTPLPPCPIPSDVKGWYEDAFQRADKDRDGFLTGREVRSLWLRSRLDGRTLGIIWRMVDTRRTFVLDKEEFCIGMFLIDERLRGKPVPQVLPRDLATYLSAAKAVQGR
ncbi:hypothetical protein HDU96_006603 [Phlyctochytrium bullatum]|nr:hypothetical protein HDU96_006603 [Phlyctochytrium bullatum]